MQPQRTTPQRVKLVTEPPRFGAGSEVNSMSIEFFKLPAALKKAIWAAYLAEWKKKQAAKKPATH